MVKPVKSTQGTLANPKSPAWERDLRRNTRSLNRNFNAYQRLSPISPTNSGFSIGNTVFRKLLGLPVAVFWPDDLGDGTIDMSNPKYQAMFDGPAAMRAEGWRESSTASGTAWLPAWHTPGIARHYQQGLHTPDPDIRPIGVISEKARTSGVLDPGTWSKISDLWGSVGDLFDAQFERIAEQVSTRLRNIESEVIASGNPQLIISDLSRTISDYVRLSETVSATDFSNANIELLNRTFKQMGIDPKTTDAINRTLENARDWHQQQSDKAVAEWRAREAIEVTLEAERAKLRREQQRLHDEIERLQRELDRKLDEYQREQNALRRRELQREIARRESAIEKEWDRYEAEYNARQKAIADQRLTDQELQRELSEIRRRGLMPDLRPDYRGQLEPEPQPEPAPVPNAPAANEAPAGRIDIGVDTSGMWVRPAPGFRPRVQRNRRRRKDSKADHGYRRALAIINQTYGRFDQAKEYTEILFNNVVPTNPNETSGLWKATKDGLKPVNVRAAIELVLSGEGTLDVSGILRDLIVAEIEDRLFSLDGTKGLLAEGGYNRPVGLGFGPAL